MVNFGPVAAEIGSLVWGNPANFNGFRVLTALLHSTLVWASAQLCGAEQRAPPIFGRATITLGIGPHSIVSCFSGTCSSCDCVSQEPNSDYQKREHQATVWSLQIAHERSGLVHYGINITAAFSLQLEYKTDPYRDAIVMQMPAAAGAVGRRLL